MLSSFNCIQLFSALWTVAARLFCPWDSPGKNTGVHSHAQLQGIFPTQGWSQHLMSPVLAGGFYTTSATKEAPKLKRGYLKIHVNPWLIHVKVWQKPLQYCKVISLQLIKINEKKKKKKKIDNQQGSTVKKKKKKKQNHFAVYLKL